MRNKSFLFWTTLAKVSEKVQAFLDGEDDEEKPGNQVKIDKCVSRIDDQLAAYRAVYVENMRLQRKHTWLMVYTMKGLWFVIPYSPILYFSSMGLEKQNWFDSYTLD